MGVKHVLKQKDARRKNPLISQSCEIFRPNRRREDSSGMRDTTIQAEPTIEITQSPRVNLNQTGEVKLSRIGKHSSQDLTRNQLELKYLT
jgi:hypothetical protein